MAPQAAQDMSFTLTWSPWGSRLLPSSFSLWKILVPCGHRAEISVSVGAANRCLLLLPRLASPSYPPGNWSKTASLPSAAVFHHHDNTRENLLKKKKGVEEMAQSQVSESGDSHRIWQIIFELCLHIVCDPFFNTLTENVQKHATVQ